MKKASYYIKNILITLAILVLFFVISLFLQRVFDVREHITAVFVFAVFLISLLTDGYAYGIVAAIASVLAVNYAFTFPYLALNFTISVNFISAVIMIIIAILTSFLTTKIKLHEVTKAEGERERMRANLLRAVSHDLRTPLTTIYGSSSVLLENRDRLTDEQQNEMLLGIKEDSEWLIRMVENLLSITRIDSGKVKIIKTPTVLEELIDSVILKFNKRYPEQSVTLDIPEDIVVIPMDAMLIEQVLINLLDNAVEHAKGMTSLCLRVSVNGQRAVFEVEDNGCGIKPERLSHIFSGYSDSADEPTDSRSRSAGIGLSVCATIVKAHGGEISAESIRTGGTCFRFSLSTEDTVNEQQI